MDTPLEEQEMFHNITSKIAALEPEITEPNFLSMNNIKYVSMLFYVGNLQMSNCSSFSLLYSLVHVRKYYGYINSRVGLSHAG